MRPAGLRALSLVPSGPIEVLNSSLPRSTFSAKASLGMAVDATRAISLYFDRSLPAMSITETSRETRFIT